MLVMASYSKGGVSEWLEMRPDEFVEWLEVLKELQKDVRK